MVFFPLIDESHYVVKDYQQDTWLSNITDVFLQDWNKKINDYKKKIEMTLQKCGWDAMKDVESSQPSLIWQEGATGNDKGRVSSGHRKTVSNSYILTIHIYLY